MVFTRSQIENLSREELIEELVNLSDITDRRRSQVRLVVSCFQLSVIFSYRPIRKERCE